MNLKLVLMRLNSLLLAFVALTTAVTPAVATAGPGPQTAASSPLPTPDRLFSSAAPALSPDWDLTAMGALTTTLVISNTYSWTKTWGDSGGTGMTDVWNQTTDAFGNVYLVGYYQGTVNFDPSGPNTSATFTSTSNSLDAFVSKFDANGNYKWAKTWGGKGRDVGYGVDTDTAGNIYVVGPYRFTVDFNPDPVITDTHTSKSLYNGDSSSDNNIYLSKFASDGTYQWVKTWGPDSGGAESYNVLVSGNYLYMVGDFSGITPTDFNPWGGHDMHMNHQPASGAVYFDAFLVKFSLDGTFQWANTWGGEGYDDGPGVAVDGSGNVYVAGMYASKTIDFDPAEPNNNDDSTRHPAHDSGQEVDVFLNKFDASGNWQWVRTWGATGTEEATGLVTVDSANNVYVAGRFNSTGCNFNGQSGGAPDLHSTQGDFDAFVSKYGSDGTYAWTKTWGGTGADQPGTLKTGHSGNMYVAGWFRNSVDFNPGSGTAYAASKGNDDGFLSLLDTNGNFKWVKTWGGTGADRGGAAVDAAGNIYTAGQFQGTVNFNPDGGVDPHTALGQSDAFVSLFAAQAVILTATVYLPLAIR